MYLQDEGLDKVVKLHLKSSTQHQKQKIATIENENIRLKKRLIKV